MNTKLNTSEQKALNTLLDWYVETTPSHSDIENELRYHKIPLSLYDFLDMIEGITNGY